MTRFSILGIPHDDNSSFMKGPAEAPPLSRRKFHSDAYCEFSESGVEIAARDRIRDHGDIQFGGTSADPWALIEETVRRIMQSGEIKQPIVAADIVEYNPRCDISELTAGVAAKLLTEIAGMMLKNAPAPH
jgi:arginase family enzyme